MASKQFTLTNTGTGRVEIQSVTFNDPSGIGHTANLLNLGGSSTVTGNASGLTYSLAVGDTQTFDVDFSSTGAGSGTYNGTIVIGGSSGSSATITSTVVVAGSSPPPPPPSADPLGFTGGPGGNFSYLNDQGNIAPTSIKWYFGSNGEIDGSGTGSGDPSAEGTTTISGSTQYVSTLVSGTGNNYEVAVSGGAIGSQVAFNINGINQGGAGKSAYYTVGTGLYITFTVTQNDITRGATGTVYIRNKTTLNEISKSYTMSIITGA